MAFEKGKSGNPGGRVKDKPFTDALRIELASAGDNHKALRQIARNLISLAQREDKDAMPAINTIADRLDGKPTQAITNGEDGAFEVLQRIERVIVDPANRDG